MSESLSRDEIRQRNMNVMGQDFGELFTILSEELTWMCIRWEQFRKLYADKPSRLELLNSSASFFFGVIQQVLWEDTLLAIARLAGPIKSAGKANLALRRLLPLIPDANLRTRVESILARIEGKAAFAIEFRNRQIAHRDLDLSLGKSLKPLPPAQVADADAVLDDMASLLNEIDIHYSRTTTAYRHASMINDADSLLYVLRDGLRLEEIRQQKAEKGEYNPADWNDDAPPL
jgi:hypothetical protein